MESCIEEDLDKIIKKFIEDCKRTENSGSEEVLQRLLLKPEQYAKMTHMSLGMMTELGEVIDCVKRTMFYGDNINIPALLEEIGDFEFYWRIFIDELKSLTGDERFNLKTILELNMQKRAIRYPNGYNKQDRKNRNYVKEANVFHQMDSFIPRGGE